MTDAAGSRSRPTRVHLVQTLAAALKEVADSHSAGDVTPFISDALLLDALRERATDIHFEPQSCGMMVRLRIDGLLYDAMLLNHDEGHRIVRHFKAIGGLDSSQHFAACNARFTTSLDSQPIDLRLSSIPCVGGEALSVRLLDRARVNQRLGRLGLSPRQHRQIERWLSNAFGMCLVAGPSGSGKTTTLYALLHELRNHERSVFTIEEPIEYEIDGITQTSVDRRHGLTFAEGLRAMLRLDPDFLLLGEIRDPEAARAAAEAAACGRVLLSTIHSNDAAGVVTSLRNLGLPDREIASSLRLVIAQRLVRRLCPHCRSKSPDGSTSRGPARGAAWNANGCEQCRQLGYTGRIGLFELWKASDSERNLIASHASDEELREQLVARDFRTLWHDGRQKAKHGLTTLAEVRQAIASYPTRRADKAAQT